MSQLIYEDGLEPSTTRHARRHTRIPWRCVKNKWQKLFCKLKLAEFTRAHLGKKIPVSSFLTGGLPTSTPSPPRDWKLVNLLWDVVQVLCNSKFVNFPTRPLK